jgi:hypothetical protein
MKHQIIGFVILFYLLFFFKKNNFSTANFENKPTYNTFQIDDSELIYQINEIRSQSNDSTRFNEISVFFRNAIILTN